MKYNSITVCTIISCGLFIENANASWFHDFSNSDTFNSLYDTITGAVTKFGLEKGKEALQSIGKPKEDTAQLQETAADKQRRFFTENHYFVVKDIPYLCMYVNNMLLATSPVINITERFFEGNIYYFNNKYYIYSEKDTFTPVIGYFKEINLEDGKVYIYKGVQCIFNKGQLQSLQGNFDLTTNTTAQNSEANTDKNENGVDKRAKTNTREMQTILELALQISKKTKIFDISKYDFNELNNEKYKLIKKTILENKQNIKAIIIYINDEYNDNNEESNNDNNEDKSQQPEELKKFCKKNNIKLYTITRPKVHEFIEEQFDNEEANEIVLKKYDMGLLKTAEMLTIYTRITNIVQTMMLNEEDDHEKMKLFFSAKKVNPQCKKNLKIIMSLAKKYKNYVTVKIATKDGVKTIK